MSNKQTRYQLFALITVILIACIDCNSQSPVQMETYMNPVIKDQYMGDPFMLVNNNTYYVYGTNASGEGFKCWSSTDLKNWKEEGFVFRKSENTWGGGNFWAPEVYLYNNNFYLAFSCRGNESEDSPMLLCLATSKSPTGPFKELYAPWFDMGFSCIDAHIFFDDDNQIYLYFDRVGSVGKWPEAYLYGIIYCIKLNDDLKPAGDTVLCSQAEQDWEHPLSMHSRCNEGCFVQKYKGRYYMTYSANHYTDPFYGIGFSTSDSPLGPWTKSASNPIIGLNEENGIYGPGHNAFFRSPDGRELFIIYHSHVSGTDKRRQVNIDRVYFDDDGNLQVKGPTKTPQLLPSGTGTYK